MSLQNQGYNFILQIPPIMFLILFSHPSAFTEYVELYNVGSEAKGSNSNFANFTGERKNIVILTNAVEFS